MDGLGPDDGTIFNARQDDWPRWSRGLAAIVFPCAGDLAEVLHAAGTWNPGMPFLFGGESRNHVGHTVIASGRGVLHDPHPDQVGIVGPMADGYFWVTYIVGAAPSLDTINVD